jgi:predicted secreted protein
MLDARLVSRVRIAALAGLVWVCVGGVAPGPATAQTAVGQLPTQNLLQLSAQASADVPQDVLAITLSVMREGSDATAVQAQLKQAMDAALTEARKAVQAPQLEVRSGNFSLYPRYSNPSRGEAPRVSGWQGQATMTIEGRDFARITELAGRLNTLQVQNVQFGLSRQAREVAEKEVAAQAIGRFRAQADEYTRLLGMTAFSIREVSVQRGTEAGSRPMLMARGAAMAADASAPVPVEPGKAQVTVSVSGSVQMR